jgi:hypothetical protein
MIDVILDHCGRPGLKAMMSVIGEDCGGQRLPKGTAGPEAVAEMERELRRMGFFEWGRKRTSRTPAAK